MQEWPQYTLRDMEAEYGGRTQSEKLRPNFTETTENKFQPIRPIFMARAWTAHRKNSKVSTARMRSLSCGFCV